ncbi:hypothetical protein MBLNU459_g3036t2 [Dothideomycetes sp. NU459]
MELLVHASAPSSRKHDQTFIRQARAYSSFVPVTGRPSCATKAAPQQCSVAKFKDADFPQENGIHTTRLSPSIYLDDTQLARTALESQIITSSLAQASALFDADTKRRESPEVEPPHIPIRYATPPVGYSFEDGSSSMVASCQRRSENSASQIQDSDGLLPVDQTSTSSGVRKRQRQTVDVGFAKQQRASSPPFVPVREDQDWTVGYVGEPPSFDLGDERLTRAVSNGRPSTHLEQTFSSDGDDIPSQLPSTYSLSDVTSPSKGSAHLDHFPPMTSTHVISITPSGRPRERPPEPSIIPVHARTSVPDSTPCAATSTGKENINTEQGSIVSTINGLPSSPASRNDLPLVLRDPAIRQDSSAAIVDPKTPSKGSTTNLQHDHHSSSALVPATLMPPPRTRVFGPDTPKATPEQFEVLNSLSWTIVPAPPATTSDSFQTHVTPNLKTLLKKHPGGEDVASQYNPRHVARTIRISERGYWSVDPGRWSIDQQIKFWGLLERFIGSGNAGWGVWCIREVPADMTLTNKIGRRAPGLGLIKVFCWGEVVMHIYLALFVASSSRIRKADPVWVDAEGEVVIQMH